MLVMPDQPPVRVVDSRRSAFVSFAPPDPTSLGSRGRTPTRRPVAVGPGRASIAEPNRDSADVGVGVTYPIQAGKIQPPNLRDETLARTRLLDWLDVKIHRRLVYVIADAGYGKTTLLADFSRRTRLRTLWYRLDEEDRDWVGFLAHLVAAGREHDPSFAPRTASILRSLEPGGPTREDAVDTFIEELPSIAADGAALILDDFHLADEVADIRMIAREIVTRGPARLSIVFASRRAPSIPVSKFRSLGELAELGIADLRFSESEMEQLFRETFGRPLEPDVLVELARRTEGWAASLTLVQAALRERTPAETRSFVRGLSGARDELHDYLAEEVVGDLPAVQQQFLMRTSLLQRVTPELAQVATGLDAIEVQAMITEAERLGLLGRRAKRRSSEQRYHPLVREFLEDRLRREIGAAGLDELHVTIATWAEPSDWRTAAYHYAEARRWDALMRVLEGSIQSIVAVGAFAYALDIASQLPPGPDTAPLAVLRSRRATADGNLAESLGLARRAVSIDPDSEVAASNLLSAQVSAGEMSEARPLAEALARTADDPLIRELAFAASVLIDTSLDYDLTEARALFEGMAERFHDAGQFHFEGVSWLNASHVNRVRGDLDSALRCASNAIDALSASSSLSELASASFAKGDVLALVGRLSDARRQFYASGTSLRQASRVEYLTELADVEAMVGSYEEAERLISEIDHSVIHAQGHFLPMIKATIGIRRGDASVTEVLDEIDVNKPVPEAGHRSRVMACRALVRARAGQPDATETARAAVRFADRQNAGLWREVASLALAFATGRVSTALHAVPATFDASFRWQRS
jgi:LuxR family maltose regulon positive regulatory protein